MRSHELRISKAFVGLSIAGWLTLYAACGFVGSAGAQEAPAEPARREISGTIIALDTFGAVVQTETGPVRVQIGPGQADRFGFAQGLGELVPGLGPRPRFPGFLGQPGAAPGQALPGGIIAPPPIQLPVEFTVRVTTTTVVIGVDDRLAYRARIDSRTEMPLEPLRSVERIPAGEAGLPLSDEPAGDGDDTDGEADVEARERLVSVRVTRRRNNDILVESKGRTLRLPLDRDAVVRFTTTDPRWIAIGDRVQVTGRQNQDESLQATRLRVEHLDPVLADRELPADDFAASADEGEEVAEIVVADDPMAPAAPAAGVAPRDPLPPIVGRNGAARAFGRRVRIN